MNTNDRATTGLVHTKKLPHCHTSHGKTLTHMP